MEVGMLEMSDSLKRRTSNRFCLSTFLLAVFIAFVMWIIIMSWGQGEATAQNGNLPRERVKQLGVAEDQADSLKEIANELKKIRIIMERQVRQDGKK